MNDIDFIYNHEDCNNEREGGGEFYVINVTIE